jgi:methionyl-tRNA formyltransferase
LRIFFVGIYGLGARALEALLQREFRVVGLLTKPDPGEGQRELLDLAAREDLPVFMPASPDERGLAGKIRALKPDLLTVAGYHRRIPQVLLQLAPLGTINTHLSLLPRYRGPCPWKWALLHGERTTGVTIHGMTSVLDRGPILAQRSCPIREEDTAESLFQRLSELGAVALADTLAALEIGAVCLREQDEQSATYFGSPTDADAQIRWDRPAWEIRNLVRGLHPRPGAWTLLGNQRIRISSATAFEEIRPPSPPGTVVGLNGGLPTVVTGRGLLRIDGFRLENPLSNLHHFPGSIGSILSA